MYMLGLININGSCADSHYIEHLVLSTNYLTTSVYMRFIKLLLASGHSGASALLFLHKKRLGFMLCKKQIILRVWIIKMVSVGNEGVIVTSLTCLR